MIVFKSTITSEHWIVSSAVNSVNITSDVGPNITGNSAEALIYEDVVLVGAFSSSSHSPNKIGWSTGNGYALYQNFNARNSSAIFGSASTVQPQSVRLLPCIKF